MDRRKNQIQNKVDEIIEEKNLLQSYLDNIIGQLYSCVELTNGTKQFKHKDYTLILKYELEVFKKITEMILELECLIDQSPLEQLKMASHGNYVNVTTESLDLTVKAPIAKEKQEKIELAQQELSDIACSSDQLAEVNSSAPTDIKNTGPDIQNIIREALKKFNEKLGLNSEYISSMTNIYQKPSTDCSLEYYGKPSTSQVSQYRIDSTNVGLEMDLNNGFEMPEKDTNKTISCENESSENDYILQSAKSSEKVEIVSSPFCSTHNLNSIEDIHKDIESKKVYTADGDSSSDISCANATESSSSEECVTGQTNHCSPLISQNNLIVDNSPDEADDNVNLTNGVAYTALEKLNNIKVFDRQAEAVAKMQAVNQPDISLKPTENRIKNNLDTNDKKSKKKKNKKNKVKENEFYELVPKSAPKSGMDCAFSHVETPNEFYLHVVDDMSIRIDELTEQYNDTFRGTGIEYKSKDDAFNALGTFCFCFVTSFNSWYRARITDWELEGKSEDVLVQLVDYGDKRRVSYKNLRRMTKEAAEIPMLAVRCHLALMYPPNSTVTNRLTEWPSATIDALMDLSGLLLRGDSQRETIFRIVYANQEENSVSVDLYNLQDSEEQTVGQILLDLGLAVQIIEEEYGGEHEELDIFLQDVDFLETPDNINEAVMGYDPRDEVRICRFTKSDGTCYKGKNCKLEHAPLSKDGFTTDQIPIFKEAMYSLALPSRGEKVTILLTAYKDVCNYFAQIVWKPRKEKNYIIDEDLYSLLANMNTAKTVRSYESFKVPPAIGEIVIVKHWSDKCLRAVVREEIVENDGPFKYQVFTLDFGEFITVALADLRKINPHFLELPFQAVECYLHNAVAKPDCDKEAKEFFVKNLYYHNFVARTMSSSLPLKLAVMTFDRRDIGKMLIKERFAQDRQIDLNAADDCVLEVF